MTAVALGHAEAKCQEPISELTAFLNFLGLRVQLNKNKVCTAKLHKAAKAENTGSDLCCLTWEKLGLQKPRRQSTKKQNNTNLTK